MGMDNAPKLSYGEASKGFHLSSAQQSQLVSTLHHKSAQPSFWDKHIRILRNAAVTCLRLCYMYSHAWWLFSNK